MRYSECRFGDIGIEKDGERGRYCKKNYYLSQQKYLNDMDESPYALRDGRALILKVEAWIRNERKVR